MSQSKWKWVGASARGTSHEACGERRQDAYRVLTVGDFLIMAACDGAGSAKHGGAGAALMARMMSTFAQQSIAYAGCQPSIDEIVDWIGAVRNAIFEAAEQRCCEVSAFAATLVLAISDGDTTQVLHIGDGTVVGRRAGDHSYEVLSWPHSGEYVSETFFITDTNVQLRVYVSRKPVDRLAVMTDGLERLALSFSERTAHTNFFDAIFGPIAASAGCGFDAALSEKLGSFLGSPSVNARTDDDKTIILAARV